MKSVSTVFALLPNTFSTSTSTGQPDLDIDLAERLAQYRQAVEAARLDTHLILSGYAGRVSGSIADSIVAARPRTASET